MLAGYLPFDDDPANPEGDNINLLYKYIVSTPLTFPEYVTPHARDLLKRILVPDPRKRADLFEVARHSWLADYAHVVGFITTSNAAETAQQGSVYASKQLHNPRYCDLCADPEAEEPYEQPPPLARSASVREPTKAQAPPSAHGGLTAKRDQINATEKPKTTRDNKRRTVQVEYVAPQSQTQRGEASPPVDATPKARPVERVPVEPTSGPMDGYQSSSGTRPPRSAGGPPQTRPGGQPQRSVSDYTAFGTMSAATTRPSTSGAVPQGTAMSKMPSRGNSYAQPAAATVAPTNAEGRFSQPKGKNYSISAPYPQQESATMGEPSIVPQPSAQRVQSIQMGPAGGHPKNSHKRSNTVTETIGRMTSMFGGRQNSYSQDPKGSVTSQDSYSNQGEERKQKRYPPTSMPASMSNDNSIGSSGPRPSTDSRRRPSFSFSRKNTDDGTKTSRRFSLIPSSLSRTFQRESMPADGYGQRRGSNAGKGRNNSRSGITFGRGNDSRSPSQSTMGSNAVPGFYDGQQDSNSRIRHPNASTHSHSVAGPSSAPPQQTQFAYPSQAAIGDDKFPNPQQPHPTQGPNRPYGRHPNDSQSSEVITPTLSHGSQPQRAQYPQGMGSEPEQRGGKLQKHRKFEDAYESTGGNKGSSGSSKKVMDFFRQMGRRRAGK